MGIQAKPIGKDFSINFSEAARKRHEMVVQCYDRLQHFAFRAQSIHGFKNDEVVVVCIKVDCDWRPIVDALMPNYNWQEIRDQGLMPVARGSAMFPICEVVAERLPDIEDVLLEKPREGFFKCIALDEGGGTVYEIEPKEQKDN
jgi:hypothetical protein